MYVHNFFFFLHEGIKKVSYWSLHYCGAFSTPLQCLMFSVTSNSHCSQFISPWKSTCTHLKLYYQKWIWPCSGLSITSKDLVSTYSRVFWAVCSKCAQHWWSCLKDEKQACCFSASSPASCHSALWTQKCLYEKEEQDQLSLHID